MNKILQQIQNLKNELGNKMVIPAHHYEMPEIVALSDFLGDSYKLAVDCSKVSAEFIVFCGVYFMAEAADVLSKPEQTVIMPDNSARCPMADLIDFEQANRAFQIITEQNTTELVPVVYMNSTAEIKHFCGSHNGSVCTSSNAAKIVQHFLDQGKNVFFAPDFNLGINTARKLKLDDEEIATVSKDLKLIGNPQKARLFLWDGYCYVHKQFSLEDIDNLRKKYENIKIIVHPECDEEVVNASDDAGSTAQIYQAIKKSPAGSIWGVGTEYNFVKRINYEFTDKTIIPLRKSICRDMSIITPEKLLETLHSIKSYLSGQNHLKGIVLVKNDIKQEAVKALKKMIQIVEKQ